MKRKTKLAS